MGNRTGRTAPTNSTTTNSNTTPRIDQQPVQGDAPDAPEEPPIAPNNLPVARAGNRFPELIGLIEQSQMNMSDATVSVEQPSFDPSLPSLTADRSQQRRQENLYVRLPLSSAQAEAVQRHVFPLRRPNPPAVRITRRRNRLPPLSNQLSVESSNSAATVTTTQAGATAATGTTATSIPAGAIAATSREGASEQQPNDEQQGRRTIAERRAARLIRAPSLDSQGGVHSARDRTSTSAYRSVPVDAPRQPPTTSTISLTPAVANQPERSRQPPTTAQPRASQRIEVHPPRPTQSNDQDEAMVDESAGNPPSSTYNFGRKAYSAAGAHVARWSPHLAATVPPPPLEPPPPPPQPRSSLVAAASASPVQVKVVAQSPMALDRSCVNTAVGESSGLAVTVPPPPLPPPPPPPARHSFSVAAESDPVHYAAPTCATRQPTTQLRNRDQANARQSAAAADTALPAEPHRTQKERQQRQSQAMQHRRHGEVQTRRLDATTSRPLPRMLNEALDEDKLLAIRRIAAQRGIARRSSAATGSDSVWCGDVFAAGTADAATSPQPFSVFEFDDSAVVEAERREFELRRAQHELYDDELWRRTGEAAAASSPVSRRPHCDSFTFGEASAVAAVRRSATSAPESTTASQWGTGRPASSRGAEGGVGCSQSGIGGISGLPLCGRLQPEAGYYCSNQIVPK